MTTQATNQAKDTQVSNFKEFNAALALKDFDPTVSRPFGQHKNALELGHTYIFTDTGRKERWGDKNLPVVKGDDGVLCNSPYIASCMLMSKGIELNGEMDEKFHCIHNPRTAKSAELKDFDFVKNHLREDGSFPKLRVIKTAPVAVKVADLLANAKEETKAVYQQALGIPLDKVKSEYVPAYRKSTYGNGDGLYTIKLSIVELVEEGEENKG